MNSKDIAAVMVECVNEILFPHFYKEETSHSYKHTLIAKIGYGARTYHQKKSRNQHVIVFGKKLIESKSKSINDSSRWLTFKEIKQYDFFDGEISLKILLVATVIHEFGHYIQTVRGHRLPGSVHNKEFYAILIELYQDGFGETLLDYFNNDIRTCDIEFQSKEDIIDRTCGISHSELFIGAEFDDSENPSKSFFVASFGRKYAYCIHEDKLSTLKILITSIPSIRRPNKSPFISSSVGNLVQFNFDNKILSGKIHSYKTFSVMIDNENGRYTIPLFNLISVIPQNNKKTVFTKYTSDDIFRGDIISFKDRDGDIIKLPVFRVNRLTVSVKSEFVDYKVPYSLILDKIL